MSRSTHRIDDVVQPRVLFITNFATHYRVPVFCRLAEMIDVEFVFFTEGQEEYWQQHLGVSSLPLPYELLTGSQILPKVRLNLALVRRLLRNDFDVVVKCTNGRFELPVVWLLSRLLRKKFVLWTGLWRHPDTLFHRLSRPLLEGMYRRADAVVVYGEHVAAYVAGFRGGREGVFVAENAIDNRLFSRSADPDRLNHYRKVFRTHPGKRVVLSVSRLSREKGLEGLIEAISGMDDRPLLVVVGTGPEEAYLQSLAADLDVEMLVLKGLQNDELIEVYESVDVSVLPSVTTPQIKETWGLVCNESMLRGVPLVVTDAVGAAAGGLVRNEETGLVVAEGNSRALRAALERVLGDDELRCRLVSRALDRVTQTTPEAMAQAFCRAVLFAWSAGR